MLIVVAAVLGLCVGSFLNVVAWRVPKGRSVVQPASACPSCGTPISGRDNLPVLSWVLLRGRCRSCGAPISPRYPAVELATAVLFALVAWRVDPVWAVPAFCAGVAGLLVLSIIDLEVLRVPDKVLGPTLLLVAAGLVFAAVVDDAGGRLGRAAAGAAIGFGSLLVVHLLVPRGMGFGDVKLATLCGALCGWVSWWALVAGLYGAFVLGAVVGVGLMAAGKARKGVQVPFAPFLAAAAAIAVLVLS